MKINTRALKKAAFKTVRAVRKYSPIILAFAAGVGTVETAVQAVKASKKAEDLIDKYREATGSEPEGFDKVKVVAPAYAKTLIFGAVTIASIGGITGIGWSRQTRLVKTVENQHKLLKAYRDAAYATAGAEGTKLMNDYMAKKELEENPISNEGEELFYIEPTHTWMRGTLYDIMCGVQDCNNAFERHSYLTVAQMYYALGYNGDADGWEGFGWFIDNGWFNCNEDSNLYMTVSDKKPLNDCDNLEYRVIYVESAQEEYDTETQYDFKMTTCECIGGDPAFNPHYLWAPDYIWY